MLAWLRASSGGCQQVIHGSRTDHGLLLHVTDPRGASATGTGVEAAPAAEVWLTIQPRFRIPSQKFEHLFEHVHTLTPTPDSRQPLDAVSRRP